MPSFDYIALDAQQCSSSWSLKDQVSFHYLNPNGLIQAQRKIDDQVRDIVDTTGCPNGVLWVHGSLDLFYGDRIRDLYAALDSGKRPGRISVHVAFDGYAERNAKAQAWVDEQR
jgi:hypothetical protein